MTLVGLNMCFWRTKTLSSKQKDTSLYCQERKQVVLRLYSHWSTFRQTNHSHSLSITLALLSDDHNQPWVSTTSTNTFNDCPSKQWKHKAVSLQWALHLVLQQLLWELFTCIVIIYFFCGNFQRIPFLHGEHKKICSGYGRVRLFKVQHPTETFSFFSFSSHLNAGALWVPCLSVLKTLWGAIGNIHSLITS